MEEIGVVKKISGIMAVVAVEGKSACEQCKVGCKITDSGAELEALNRARAEIGQRVRVELKPYSYLKGSVIAYGLPALALVIGAVLGKELFSGILSTLDPDLVSAIFGFGAFLLTFVIVKLWSMKVEKTTEYTPVIEEIIE
ncbi:MAG TPA: SoxR reducing system RseC family protein [Thermodesulfovibrionales bacterium]|nr:SoxR reducing system RseC family protein [Thermodesulfovibrionales bacterium]